MNEPPTPARNEAIPNASSLVLATEMPTDAPARSLDRTARNRRPVALRARLPTATAHTVTTMSTRIPNSTRAMVLPSLTPRFRPNRVGSEMGLPNMPVMEGLRKTNSSSATAPDSVTTASCAPRMRSAGIPTTTPKPVASSATNSGEIGNGMPTESPSLLSAKPAAPAIAACASEICPTNPVSTTSDSMTMVMIMLVMTPKR